MVCLVEFLCLVPEVEGVSGVCLPEGLQSAAFHDCILSTENMAHGGCEPGEVFESTDLDGDGVGRRKGGEGYEDVPGANVGVEYENIGGSLSNMEKFGAVNGRDLVSEGAVLEERGVRKGVT